MPSVASVLVYLVIAALAVPVANTKENQTEEVNMNTKFPKLKLQWLKFIVPTLEMICGVLAKSIRSQIYGYSIQFSSTLMRHFSGETEVQIVDAEITPGSRTLLANLEADMEVLQYRNRLAYILEPWQQKLGGQPLNPEIQKMLPGYARDIVEDFERFILELQTHRSPTEDSH